MNSLRARLLFGLLGAVVAIGLGGGWFVYRNALNEANAFFDRQLEETAMLLREQAYGFVEQPGLPEQVPRFEFVVQVVALDGRTIYRSQPGVSLPETVTLGLSTVETREGRWRIFGVLGPYHVIQVAQPTSVRESRAARLALRTLAPFALLVPALALLVLWIVRRTLKPLDALTRAIAHRPAESLESLPVAALPAEVRPLVDEINVLLGRLGSVLARERSFTADAAHELRSPLTALRLQLERLGIAIEDGDGAERRDAHAQLHAGVERATRLVEQLLAMARLEGGGRREQRAVALDQLAREVVEASLPLADQRGVDLGLARSEPLVIEGEPEGLRALLGNLVDNAVRHAPRGGHVDLAVYGEAVGTDASAVLEVVDDGPGIPAAERGRVFDRFYRVPGVDDTGSGIGLAIVRAVVDRHAGQVELADGPGGRGLLVRVRLPQVAMPVGPAASPAGNGL